MVEVEFKRDRRDGRDKLLDVNPRAWGWHALCQLCGVDFPMLAYREALRGAVSPLAYVRSFAGPTSRSVLDARDPLPAIGDTAVAAWRLASGKL